LKQETECLIREVEWYTEKNHAASSLANIQFPEYPASNG